MKKKSLILLILSVVLVLASCSSSGSTTVFGDGETEYVIVTAENASGEEKELAKALFDLSGANPEIVTDSSPESRLEIIIGDAKRSVVSEFSSDLVSEAEALAFHYIIAEQNGKIVIISDAEIGYIYALDYIKENLIDGGELTLSKGTYVKNRILWDSYYASDLYLDRITAEADKNRYESEKNQLENEMNKYEEDKGSSIMTMEQAIEQYKTMLAAFNTSDFGDYSSTIFTSGTKYRKPTVYPETGAHPRILFTENTIAKVRESLTAPENEKAYNRYITLSDTPCDGKFTALTGTAANNYNADITSRIEAKAFRYAMTGEKIYGYEAIYAAKNAMLTIDVKRTVIDSCRTYGHLMYVVSCVYDWCYDLMTDADKAQFIAGGVFLLGANQEVVYQVSSTNLLPTGQGVMYGHGAEDQILTDYLAFAIACADEAPEIYELVGGRVLNDYVEGQNFLAQSGSHWEGSMYGSVRAVATMMANNLISGMTEGKVIPFENMESVITAATYWIRPDGQVYRIGDINENNTSYQFVWMANNCFYAGNLYDNEYLKSFAYKYLREFNYFSNMVAGLSAVQFLALNDTDVSYVYKDEVPLTYSATYPNTTMFAKSANNDKNAFGVYMTMPETCSTSHAHMECGSFQIYYKGALVTDSGAYDGWGGTHHMGYNMNTVSANTLLIYNPALVNYRSPLRKNMIYCGGQSTDKAGGLPDTLQGLMNHPALNWCTTLGTANVEKEGKYLYSYMGGDMTKAYDDITVDRVVRYMFAVATGDEDCPLVFITYDKITSDDASFRKSALIHVQNEPTIIGNYSIMTDATGGKLVEKSDPEASDNYAIVTNGSGKLVVQSVGDETEFTVIGGSGYEFWIPGVEDGQYSLEAGVNIPQSGKLVPGSLAEYGWGRIEISPKTAAEANQMLTVMYVTDTSNSSAPKKAENISSDTLAGSMLFGKAVLFPKAENKLSGEASFTLTEGGECFVAGVEAGTWKIMNGNTEIQRLEVAEGTNMLTFNAQNAGTYTLTPVK